MSKASSYFLAYERQPYVFPTPMVKDKTFIRSWCRDRELPHVDFCDVDGEETIFFWLDHRGLTPWAVKHLMADQVFERRETELWIQLKPGKDE